jgi:hypothetical protein
MCQQYASQDTLLQKPAITHHRRQPQHICCSRNNPCRSNELKAAASIGQCTLEKTCTRIREAAAALVQFIQSFTLNISPKATSPLLFELPATNTLTEVQLSRQHTYKRCTQQQGQQSGPTKLPSPTANQLAAEQAPVDNLKIQSVSCCLH